MAHINIPLSGAVRKFPIMKFSEWNTLTLTLSENFPCKRHAMEELPFSLRSPNSRIMKMIPFVVSSMTSMFNCVNSHLFYSL